MDKKTFFHKVSQMRAAQREYFKTRSSAALASSKLLERQIDEEIKRAKAIMAAKAKLFYELVNTDPQTHRQAKNGSTTISEQALITFSVMRNFNIKVS